MNDIKIDNMRYQHNERIRESKEAEQPAAPHRPYAIVSVASGDGLAHIMREMGAAYIIEGGRP